MWFLIAEILVSLLVAAALGALIAWLAKDLLAKREIQQLEEGWQSQLRDSEARAGTFKNQLAEAKQTEENLRADLRLFEENRASLPQVGGDSTTVAALNAELAGRDKKIEVLKLQVSQSEAALTSEWQSLKALKTEVAERQRRLDSRAKERDSRLADELKESEKTRDELKQEMVDLKQELSGVREASEQALADERHRTSARAAEVEKARAELGERDATIARLTEALKRAESVAGLPEEDDDLEQLRGVGPVLHRKLNEAGIHSFRQIASWTDDDVEQVASEIGRPAARIRRDGWVERAGELLQARDQS